MDSFEDFCQRCSNDDLWLTLTIFMARSNLFFELSYEFIEQKDGLGAKFNKYSQVNVYMNISLQYRSRSFFDL